MGTRPRPTLQAGVGAAGLTVALTGGAGFVGAALARYWLRRGARVRVLDIEQGHRLTDLAENPQLEVVVGDVRDAVAVAQLVAGVQLVVHLAAVVGVHRYLENPDLVLDVNLGGTRCVVRACEEAGTPLLFTSTSEVYGSLPIRLREDGPVQYGDLASPRWSYALSKAAAEQVVFAASRRGLPTATVRFFNVYGPLMDAPGQGRVISTMIGAVRQGQPLALVDGGNAVRSFCYIDDAVEVVARLADDLLGPRRSQGLAINVGRDEPVAMRDLAQRIVDLTGHAPGCATVRGVDHFGPGFAEVPRRVPDLGRQLDLTGYVAQTDLDTGLIRTLSHWGLLRSAAQVCQPRPPSVPQARPDLHADGALLQSLGAIIAGPRLTNNGPEVLALQAELAQATGWPCAVAASSGFGALVLALRWAMLHRGVPSGSRAILPAYTYVATRNAVLAAGLVPTYCDIESDTWTMDPAGLAGLLDRDPSPAVIVPVTVFGVPPRMMAIAQVAERAHCPIVLDHAHGLGTEAQRSRSTAFADAVALSLHATKLVPAAEGGAVLCKSGRDAAWMAQLANSGLAWSGPIEQDVLQAGFNFKLSELHAAVARHSLRRMADRLQARRELAGQLRSLAQRAGWRVQHIPASVISNAQNVVALWTKEPHDLTELLRRAASRRVDLRRYFYPPLHRLESDPGACASLPVTDFVADRAVSLPLMDDMNEAEWRAVAGAIAPGLPGGEVHS